jgi:hypothetical protein
MAKNQKAIAYARERGVHSKDTPYKTKFANFIKTVAEAKAADCDYIIIAEPWVIGDTYDEVMESLSHLAGTKISLNIATVGKTPWNN